MSSELYRCYHDDQQQQQQQQRLLSSKQAKPRQISTHWHERGPKMRPPRMLFVYLSFAFKASANLILGSSTTSTLAEHFAHDIGLAKSFSSIFQNATPKPIPPKLHDDNPKVLEIVLPNFRNAASNLDKNNGNLHTPTRTAKQTESRRRQPHGLRDLPEPTPPPSPVLKDSPMCVFLGAALGICNSLTSGFTTMGPSMQARCLCYSSAAWSPNIFDNAVGECASFARTAAPLAYAPLADLEGFCSSIGDVKIPKSTTVTTTLSATPKDINPDCDLVTNALVSCAGVDMAFESLDATGKAKCLCYDSNTSWKPTQFDNAVKTCAEDTYLVTSLPSVQSLAGLCGGVGNVLESSTFMPSTTSTSVDESSGLPPSSLEVSTLLSTSIFPVSTLSESVATSSSPLSDSSTLTSSTVASSYSISSIQSSSTLSTPGTTSSKANSLSSSTIDISQTSTPRYIPNTILNTQTPTSPPTGLAMRRKVEKWEIILVSFCCAMLLLFLC